MYVYIPDKPEFYPTIVPFQKLIQHRHIQKNVAFFQEIGVARIQNLNS
jgi:hypothetical protein